MTQATIFGCAGPALSEGERRLFADVRPFGLILFDRNLETPDQIRALCAAFRAVTAAPDAPVFIDQEGGRVRRLRPPLCADYPAAAAFLPAAGGDLERAAALTRMAGRLIAADLAALGITANCAPVLDVAQKDADRILEGRTFATSATGVARLGRAFAEGLLAGGVLPVIKHIPGHGRATADSHAELPVVTADRKALETDFQPFRHLSDMPMAMTAHVMFTALDPREPVTTSRRGIGFIREALGFGGLLMCDDVSMGALKGDLDVRARAALDAGCDVALHCNGVLQEMMAVAAGARILRGRPGARARAALARRVRAPEPLEASDLRARLDRALGAARP